MRYLFSLVLCFLMFVLASCNVQPRSFDIGEGLILEQTSRESRLIADNTRCEQSLIVIERGEIPAKSETKTETVIVQEGYIDAVVTPTTYNKNGSVKTAAKVKLRKTPSVPKQLTYLVVKTPSGDVQRISHIGCKPILRRIIVTPATYKIKDKSGATIKEFETAEALAEYINSK